MSAESLWTANIYPVLALGLECIKRLVEFALLYNNVGC